MTATTPTLPGLPLHRPQFPSTRYQGSKRKLAAGIVEYLGGYDFTTVLDAFGGTGAMAHALKREGKHVTYNDVLAFNHQIGLALIENDSVTLTEDEIDSIGRRRTGVPYGDFIERMFEGVYFTAEENRWLDVAVGNIRAMTDKYKRALAWFALFQSAMVKRPYNLFHRGNLYMRTASVTRTFGNKVTWDRPFPEHFRRFAHEANRAVMDGGDCSRATCGDVLTIKPDFDLVYIDPPYMNGRGVGVDYQQFYHFLEGMVDYDHWEERMDLRFRHRPLRRQPQPWTDPRRIHEAFRDVFDRFRKSVLVVSYRSDGIPSMDQLERMLRDVKPRVRILEGHPYQYALSTNRASREAFLLADSS